MNTPPPLTATPASPPPSSQESANARGARDGEKEKEKEPEAPAFTPSKSFSNSNAIWLRRFADGKLGRYEPKRNKWYCNCEDSNRLAHCQRVTRLSSPDKGRTFWGCSQFKPDNRCGMFVFIDETEMAKEALEKYTKLLGVEIGVRKSTPAAKTPLTDWLATCSESGSGRKRDAGAISRDEGEGGAATPTPSRTSKTKRSRPHTNATPGPSSRSRHSHSQPQSHSTEGEGDRTNQPSVQISKAIIDLLKSEGVELPEPTRILLEDGVEEGLKKWVGGEGSEGGGKGKGKEKETEMEKEKGRERQKRKEDGKRRSERGKGKGKGKEKEVIEVIELLD